MPKEYIAEEVPAYLKEMQIVLTAGLLDEAAKQTLTLKQVIRKAKVSGMADIEIERMLLRDLREGGQLFGNFRKQMKSTVKSGIEDSGRQEVRQSFLDVKLWSWLAIVDGKICPDCLDRHGWTAMTWEEWEAVGLPDSGNTICGQNCRCILTPAGSVKKEDGGLKRPVKVPPKPKEILSQKIDPNILRWAGGNDGFTKDGKNYILYHGTNLKNSKGIIKEGIKAPVDAPKFFMLSTDKQVAKRFAGGYGGDTVVEFKIPTNDIKKVLWKGERIGVNYANDKLKGDIQHAIRNGLLSSKYINNVTGKF